jgi:hypothetical protein
MLMAFCVRESGLVVGTWDCQGIEIPDVQTGSSMDDRERTQDVPSLHNDHNEFADLFE